MPTLAAAAAMAALHVAAGALRFLQGSPRSRWLSVAGGISVAYVVVHLLPELAEHQETVGQHIPTVLLVADRHLYVLALVGLATFYGVERWSCGSKGRGGIASRGATLFAFTTYAVYNALIGYLLAGRQDEMVLFAVAMGLHFVVNDRGLRAHHARLYDRVGRWVLAAAVVVGAVAGMTVEIHEAAAGLVLAFIGGGTILNVLKEELPEERESRFGAFAAGAGVYTAVLLAL